MVELSFVAGLAAGAASVLLFELLLMVALVRTALKAGAVQYETVELGEVH